MVVEGTETEEQIAWLAALGHIEAQGFLFSRPVPVEAIPALLERFGVCGMTGRRAAHESDRTSSVSSTND